MEKDKNNKKITLTFRTKSSFLFCVAKFLQLPNSTLQYNWLDKYIIFVF